MNKKKTKIPRRLRLLNIIEGESMTFPIQKMGVIKSEVSTINLLHGADLRTKIDRESRTISVYKMNKKTEALL